MKRMTTLWASLGCVLVAFAMTANTAVADPDKPNILVIWGDDIGGFNVSAYNQGVMGYRRRTSTASPRRERCSPTGTASRAARQARRLHAPASRPSAPA